MNKAKVLKKVGKIIDKLGLEGFEASTETVLDSPIFIKSESENIEMIITLGVKKDTSRLLPDPIETITVSVNYENKDIGIRQFLHEHIWEQCVDLSWKDFLKTCFNDFTTAWNYVSRVDHGISKFLDPINNTIEEFPRGADIEKYLEVISRQFRNYLGDRFDPEIN